MKRILFIAPASFPVTGAENIVNIKLLQAEEKDTVTQTVEDECSHVCRRFDLQIL